MTTGRSERVTSKPEVITVEDVLTETATVSHSTYLCS